MNPSMIDWNAVWKEQMNNSYKERNRTCADNWIDKDAAQKYWNSERQERIKKTFETLPVQSDSRVLDIGSGPGVLAVPLAEKVAHVTAVEPSGGMLDVMKEIVEDRGISNVSCIQKHWEDIDIETDLTPPYDVVIASMSLGMTDIKEAILKMEQASKNFVVLIWAAGSPSWEEFPKTLWPIIHNREYTPGPKSDVLFNVLYQMGIYPHVEVIPSATSGGDFDSMQEAVDFYASRFNITRDDHKSRVEEILDRMLTKENGILKNQYRVTCMKMSWQKSELP